uniref:RNA helicase n=1 Tax=Glossina palpalis gambiensis TaxID=67801 RepID=A0A1B0AZM9_9MUSC
MASLVYIDKISSSWLRIIINFQTEKLRGRKKIKNILNDYVTSWLRIIINFQTEKLRGRKKIKNILNDYVTRILEKSLVYHTRESSGAIVRKVVVSTNIGETYLAIDGIVSVIDTGFAKQKVYNLGIRLESFALQSCLQSLKLQHNNVLVVLEPERVNKNVMHDNTYPEILRSNLGAAQPPGEAVGARRCDSLGRSFHLDGGRIERDVDAYRGQSTSNKHAQSLCTDPIVCDIPLHCDACTVQLILLLSIALPNCTTSNCTHDRLIKLVRAHPAIYDIHHPHYRRNPVRIQIWSKIGKELGAPSATFASQCFLSKSFCCSDKEDAEPSVFNKISKVASVWCKFYCHLQAHELASENFNLKVIKYLTLLQSSDHGKAQRCPCEMIYVNRWQTNEIMNKSNSANNSLKLINSECTASSLRDLLS